MGNNQSATINYAVEVKPSTSPNRTGVFRNPTHPDELVSSFTNCKIDNCWELFQLGHQINPHGKFLGKRSLNKDGSLGSFSWLSYSEVMEMIQSIGSGIMKEGILTDQEFPEEKYKEARKMKLLGLFSKNRMEWLILEQVANAYGITLVPLYDTLGPDSTQYILEKTKIRVIGCDAESVSILLKLLPKFSHSVKTIIAFDPTESSILAEASQVGVQIRSFDSFKASAKAYKPCPGGSSSVATLCYTSGTTGIPKGVILTQKCFVSNVVASLRGPLAGSIRVSSDDVHISYLPLAHVFERIVVNVLLAVGAAIGVYSGDTQKLMEDVKELKPSIFISVPRLFNRINDKVLNGMQEKSAIAQYLFNAGLSSKLENLRSDATVTHALWDSLVFNKIKQLMGGRLRYMLVGGAPIDAEIEERMKVFLCAPLLEGYGLTETMGASFITNPKDPLSGHVGGALPCVEFCIESVEEMDYRVTDTRRTGELLVRGNSVFEGYFMNPTETAAVLDSDGWFHTGDIVVILPNGSLKIIDRKKSMFKLAQGEYVAPERIEMTYLHARLVGQIFVHGRSNKHSLVAIVIPDEEAAHRWWKKNNGKTKNNKNENSSNSNSNSNSRNSSSNSSKPSLKELCDNPDFRKAIGAEMDEVAKQAGLKGFEKVKEFFLEPELFTVESGALTPTFKLKRHFAAKKYEKEIQSMYMKLP